MQTDWENKNSQVNCLLAHMFTGFKHEKKDKVQMP